MNEFESKMYMRVLDQRDEAVKIFKRILKIMKSDQREGDRYVYEEEKKIKEFLAQAGEGAARNEPVPPSSANDTPAARGAHSDEHAPKGIEQSPAPVSQRVLTDQEIGQLPPEVFTYAAENVDFLNSIKHADFAKGAIMCAHYLRSKGYFGVSQPQQELIRAGDAMREWMEFDVPDDANITKYKLIDANYEIATKLDALASLEDGWYDKLGKAPSKDALTEVTRMMVQLYPEELKLPAIVPTPEGNILLEWNQAGEPSVDIELATRVAEFHAFGPNEEDIEQSFNLKDEAAWKSFFRFLGQHIERTKA